MNPKYIAEYVFPGVITGYFTQVIWDGIESVAGDGSNPDLGARVVKLID